jgi:tRNA threonylcarbamoyladenosine biosynthesis protein TsaB
LLHDGKVVAERLNASGSNHAALLPLYVQELQAIAREQGLRIEAVALSDGPGSYTGLRIGASLAKGLCYGMNIPLIPIPTTQVLCASFKAQRPVNGQLLPMIDARRMEVYTALYDESLQPLSEIQACVVESQDSLPAANKDVFYFGDGAGKCQELLESEYWHFVPDIVPEAAHMMQLAQDYFAAGKACASAQQLAYYEPFYLKEFVAAKSHVKGLQS